MKRLIGTLTILLLLLAACQGRGTETRSTNYRTGTEGIQFMFASNLPPSRIYDDQKLDVLVELENRGATGVGGAGDRLYLSGFDPQIITGISAIGEQIPAMNGKSQYGPGDKTFVTFTGTPVSLFGLNIDKYSPRLQLTACYSYDTIATANVCIDPEPESRAVRDKVCTPTSVGTGSQGAPVSVSSVNVEASPTTTRFDITIQNSGRGKPFRSSLQYLQKCSPFDPTGLQYNEIDYVELVDVAVAGTSIKNNCRPNDQGHVRLAGGSAHLYCQFDHIPGTSAYTTPLTVTLRYGYREILQRELTIVQSAR
ncbi:MAG: hypothetical protein AABY13_03815 [Nanoarchaeota archaeon]